MKFTKKFISVLLAVITALSFCSFAASAATTGPVLAVEMVSETETTVVLNINLKSGTFNALDVVLTSASNLTCTKLVPADDYKNFREEVEMSGGILLQSSNIATGKIGISATEAFNGEMSLYTATYTKKTAAQVKPGDIKAAVTNCAIRVGYENVSVISSTSITVKLGMLEIISEPLELKYKDVEMVMIQTSLNDDDIVWTSSDESVATVDEAGNVKATGRGTATIKAESVDGSLVDTVDVTVKYSFGQWLIIIFLFGWIWY